MSETAALSNVVTRTRSAAGNHSLHSERSSTGAAGRVVLWLAAVAAGAIALASIVRSIEHEVETWMLTQADESGVRDALSASLPDGAPADYLEALSELSLALAKPDADGAYLAAQNAAATDPSRGYVWARLAYLETVKAKRITPAALESLTKSMDACPLCSQELVRWRFNFVLANWAAMPETLRARAFEQADLLRWTGDNAEFIAEMGIKARLAGIPFDAYRAAVKTPMKSWDILPAPETSQVEDAPADG